jgi:hypothetical protein
VIARMAPELAGRAVFLAPARGSISRSCAGAMTRALESLAALEDCLAMQRGRPRGRRSGEPALLSFRPRAEERLCASR